VEIICSMDQEPTSVCAVNYSVSMCEKITLNYYWEPGTLAAGSQWISSSEDFFAVSNIMPLIHSCITHRAAKSGFIPICFIGFASQYDSKKYRTVVYI